jgi:branched-chain amino acid transport system permease protein
MLNSLHWWRGILITFTALWLAKFILPLPFMNEILLFSIYTIGCNFLLGRVGFISFGQPAYLAVGAYATAFYLFYFGTNPFIGILIGLGVGVVFAFIVGLLFVRLRSDYFALVNLALSVIVFYMLQKVMSGVTKGDNGLWFLTNIDATPIFNLTKTSDFFLFCIFVAAAVWAIYKYLDDTIFGACCLATKINETKLEFIGYNNFKIRLTAFVIANTSTALAGSLYAIYLGAVSPEITGHARAADPVVVTILGGVGTLWGPIVGTIAYTGLRDVASKFIGNWELIVGFILVFIMMTNSVGLYGTFEKWVKSLWRNLFNKKGDA